MSKRKSFKETLIMSSLIVILLSMTHCAVKTDSLPALPKDILGITIGMSKNEAQKRLEAIARVEREGRKSGELWQLNDNPHFRHIAIAYDKENRVRFVTGLVDKETVKERIRFADVGDLSLARHEVTEPHYRYTWNVPATDSSPSQIIMLYGDDKELVTIYSLAKKNEPGLK